MQSFLNVIILQTYTFFTTLTPLLHGRSKRFFRRPQNLNAPRTTLPVLESLRLYNSKIYKKLIIVKNTVLLYKNYTIVSADSQTDVLGSYSLVIKLPDDGNPVQKHVVVNTCCELYFTTCICLVDIPVHVILFLKEVLYSCFDSSQQSLPLQTKYLFRLAG